jgi:protein-tyrosine-phosphatase
MGEQPLSAPRILVVCRANVARSPLAEVMLRAGLTGTGIDVASAGVQAITGASPARGSVDLAARRGLDLTAHRSQPVTVPLLVASTLVVTMSERHRAACNRMATGLDHTTFTLRELDRLTAELDADTGAGLWDSPATRLRWLGEAAHLRRASAPPALEPEDIPDPMGRDWDAWFALDDVLDELIGRFLRRLLRQDRSRSAGP